MGLEGLYFELLVCSMIFLCNNYVIGGLGKRVGYLEWYVRDCLF